MRKDVKKILFVGLTKQREPFFSKAQEFGVVDFIDKERASTDGLSPELEKISLALRILRGLPAIDQEVTEDYSLAGSVIDEIIQLQNALEKLQEEERLLCLEMERVEPFGDFSKESLESITTESRRHIQFFWAKQEALHGVELPDEVFYVNSRHGMDYFISIAKAPVVFSPLIETAVDKPFQELQIQFRSVESEKARLEERLKGYQKYATLLHHHLIHQLNQFNLQRTQGCAQLIVQGDVFAIEGWVPAENIHQLDALCEPFGIHFEQIAIEEGDQVPTFLENKGLARLGEDLVHIYDTPSATDKDPSLWVLAFFTLFFAMIIGDAGYGLVFVGIVVYLGYRYKKMSSLGNRVWKLGGILAGACIVWGVLVNTFFGIAPAPDSPLMKVSLVHWLVSKKIAYHFDKKDDTHALWVNKYPDLAHLTEPREIIMNAMERGNDGAPNFALYAEFADQVLMELALLIGVIHLILSMLRYSKRNWSQVGWVVFIIGSYLYLPSYLEATSVIQYLFGIDANRVATLGLYLIGGGFSLAILLAVIVHKAKGLLEVMNAIQVFGDVLSYLRLYALGMAGGLMSATINEGAVALGSIFGTLLILAGHLFNIILSIMGGIIHGLRLNFLEWYHYSFEGGGKLFRPLEKIKIE